MSDLQLTLKIWRQKSKEKQGHFETYDVNGLNSHMSFLEMMDVLNEQLIEKNKEPVAFDHDCREGICGMCSMVINGRAHGPLKGTTTCQLYMRNFNDKAVFGWYDMREYNRSSSDNSFEVLKL